jgi:glycosyltransferase involved in cell wall biosynthesis
MVAEHDALASLDQLSGMREGADDSTRPARLRVLHAYNAHRGFGGADRARDTTIIALRAGGVDVGEFVRDSRTLAPTLVGKAIAFVGGLYAAEAVREFEAVLRRNRPDVVHVHELYPLISPWILPCCERAGIPVVMTCYDFRLSCPIATHYIRGEACHRCLGGREYWCVIKNCRDSVPESIAYALRNASARLFDLFTGHVHRFIAASAFQRDFLVARAGLKPEGVVVNYCAITLPPEPVADPAEGTYVGYAGRFAHEKGVEIMVQACRAAGLPMRFAGDAPGHPAVTSTDDATFVMTHSSAELAAFYRGARIIVVPSIWSETFGIVAAEAMSHGIPVVASRIGALPEVVRDGETGLLAEPGDASDFAEKISRLWNDASLARRLGSEARRRVASEFTYQAHCDRLLRTYSAVIAETAARPSRTDC